MGKTLQRILGIGIVLCTLNKPCQAVPFYGIPPPEPNAVAKRVESGYNPKALALTTTITALVSGLTGFALGYFLNQRK
jgi:hypothetical protein